MRFRLPSRMSALFGNAGNAVLWSLVAIVGGGVFLYYSQIAYGLALVALGLVMLPLSLSPTTLFLGDDGISHLWLGRRRFFSYASIASVDMHIKMSLQRNLREEESSRGVLIVGAEGSVYLPCDDTTIRDLVAYANERIERHRRRTVADVHGLRRGDRSVQDWLASLRVLLGTGGYREASVTADALWRVVEDPSTEAEHRAAAALALRAHLGDAACPRIRVVLEGCASPKLRVALEAIDRDDAENTTDSLKRLTAG